MQIQEQSPIGVLQIMCSTNIQQIYRRTPTQKNELSKFANQLYWNQISAWVFSCKFSAYLQESCFDEYLWETTSANFHSTCLPYFSIRIRVKFRLFFNIFLISSMFSSERVVLRLPEFSLFLFTLAPCEWAFLTFCWIVFLQGGARLNCCWNAARTATNLFL